MAHFSFCSFCFNITTVNYIGGKLAQYCTICKIEYALVDADRRLYVSNSDNANILNKFAHLIKNSQHDDTVYKIRHMCAKCGWDIASNLCIGDAMIIIFVCDKCGDITKR